MKKILLPVLLIMLYACKKDAKKQPDLDITGTWTVYSSTDSLLDHSSGVSYNAMQFPCIANNVLVINADGTGVSKFTGAAACSVGAGGYFGMPGQANIPVTWTRTGNNIRFVFKYSGNLIVNSHAKVSSTDNRLQFSFRDTVSFADPAYIKHIQTGIDIKE